LCTRYAAPITFSANSSSGIWSPERSASDMIDDLELFVSDGFFDRIYKIYKIFEMHCIRSAPDAADFS
jgi:hypothetical protein